MGVLTHVTLAAHFIKKFIFIIVFWLQQLYTEYTHEYKSR